jgi:excisionase family DNA binding protein
MATRKEGKREISVPGFYTCEQAAVKLRMKADTIRRYVHRGLISAGIVGSVYLISASELRKFKENHRKPGRPRAESYAERKFQKVG